MNESIQNDPDLDGKYLGTITRDFVVIAETLKEASYQIRKQGFSNFPIFPISKAAISMGQLLLAKEDLGLEWNYYATYLDDFVQRKLIASESLDFFKETYKEPDEFCCLFVIDEEFTRFMYIPYPDEEEGQVQ